MQRIFKAREGAGFNDQKAQIYGEYLWELKENKESYLTPHEVVEAAKDKNCPLHDYFIWDDTIAAEKYRIWQARHLLGSIHVVVKYDGKEDSIRAFHNVRVVAAEEDQGYVTVKNIEENEIFLEMMLRKALKEIEEWEKKYRQFQMLRLFRPFSGIFKSIQKMRKEWKDHGDNPSAPLSL